jgi:hypothetical protein
MVPAASSLSMRIPHTGSSTIAHEPDERRPPRVLPGEPDEEQAGSFGDPAPMDNAAALVPHTGDVDPGEVRSIPGRPNDRVDLLLASVVEERASPRSARQPLHQGHAGSSKSTSARPDEHVAFRQLPTESRIGADLHEPDLGQPPEKVLAEQALRQRRNSLAHGEVHFPGRGEFLGDLEAGVSSSDHEHVVTLGQLSRVSVVGAVDLEDGLIQVASGRRDERNLEWPGRDDDLARREFLVRRRHDVRSVSLGQ